MLLLIHMNIILQIATSRDGPNHSMKVFVLTVPLIDLKLLFRSIERRGNFNIPFSRVSPKVPLFETSIYLHFTTSMKSSMRLFSQSFTHCDFTSSYRQS